MSVIMYEIVPDSHSGGIHFESQPIEQLSFYGFPHNLQANAGISSKDGPLLFSATPLGIFTHDHLNTLNS
jgi:hypothetical protein